MPTVGDVVVCVLTGFGLNCDNETAYAFARAGATARRVHINALISGAEDLDSVDILAFIGGFSWGDDHGAGVIQAVRMRTQLGDALHRFVDRGKHVIGICNGFQTLVNLGLLPGFDGDYRTRSIALTHNDCGRFRNDWVHVTVDPASPCVFTRGLDRFELPIRHGEGKVYADPPVMAKLAANHQVPLRYSLPDGQPAGGRFPYNPNGSLDDIAGICDGTGRVFGLMPHPEAFNHWTNHPDWTRRKERRRRSGEADVDDMTPGLRMLKNAVDAVRRR
jgi:phosphoribosylformylglycinamidine synthase